jgi:hypothetical protein
MTDLTKGIVVGVGIGTTLTTAFFGHIFNRCEQTCPDEWEALCDATDKVSAEGRFYSTRIMNKLCRRDPEPDDFEDDFDNDPWADVHVKEVKIPEEHHETKNCFDAFREARETGSITAETKEVSLTEEEEQ